MSIRKILAAEGLIPQKIDNSLRRKINRAMEKAGLDGNGRFASPTRGYAKAAEIMQKFGVTVDGLTSSHQFTPRPSGTVRSDIEFVSTDPNPFMPGAAISNSMLFLQYHELEEHRFEVVAYLS